MSAADFGDVVVFSDARHIRDVARPPALPLARCDCWMGLNIRRLPSHSVAENVDWPDEPSHCAGQRVTNVGSARLGDYCVLVRTEEVVSVSSWGLKSDIGKASAELNLDRADLAFAEAPVEGAVTNYISVMPFPWIDIDDEPGPTSLRGVIERNSIALLSNHERTPLDPPIHRTETSCAAQVFGTSIMLMKHMIQYF
jgi:hypothetical protein